MRNSLGDISLIKNEPRLFDAKIRILAHKFQGRLPGVVPTPVRLGARCASDVLHDAIHRYDVRSYTNQRCIGVQLGKHMCFGVA